MCIRDRSRDVADNFDFHLIIPGYLDTFLQIAAKQLHKPIHFFSGAFPVFRGKSIYCQIFHAQIFNIIADLLQIGAALNMSIATRQSLCLCPAAIAVQNNGNMIGYVHICLLYTSLLIRTSGEQRLSNFLMWQLAYTEFYFTDVAWPDFHKAELVQAIEKYNQRDRRYGGVKEE